MTLWQQAHLALLAVALCVVIHALIVRTHRTRMAAAAAGAGTAVVIANVVFLLTR